MLALREVISRAEVDMCSNCCSAACRIWEIVLDSIVVEDLVLISLAKS